MGKTETKEGDISTKGIKRKEGRKEVATEEGRKKELFSKMLGVLINLRVAPR